MGNGAKAQQRRERSGKDAKGGKSQLKVNEASKSIVCKVCRHPFMITTRDPALVDHAQSKHSKTKEECFD